MIVIGPIEFWDLYDEKGSATQLQGLTASQGDVCAIIQSECYIFIPDKSFNTFDEPDEKSNFCFVTHSLVFMIFKK